MKTLKYSLVLIFALLISGPGCKKFDLDTNDLTLSANLSIFRTMVNFTYFNAATGAPITLTPSTKLRIEVVSPVNGLIVNSGSGEFQTTFYSNYALCSFALNPYSVLPTHEKPISILVKTTLDKYMENYFTIDLAEERNYNQEIKLINLVEPPVGVIIEDHKNAGKTSGSGETKEPINIGTKDSTVSVTIEQGTILRDESGQPLSGNVSVEMMTVDVSTPEGILNVPALSQPLRTEDGTLSALFNPVAYSRVQITDDAGHKAATVTGKDMVITTSLNPTIMNPRTRKPVTEGDLVPCYYFNGREGSWKFFGQDTVTRENGKLLLVKIIRSKKSTGDENFSEITYSFDQNSPVDLQLNINLPATKPTVPTGFNVVVKGFDYLGTPTVLFNNGITVFTNNTRFTINNLNADYVSYSTTITGIELLDASGVTQLRSIAELEASSYQLTFAFNDNQFRDPVSGDGPTRLYLQFSCIPTSGNPLFMDSPYLPNSFYLIFSGTGFTGETILEIQGGSFMVPFNPMLQTGGSWQAKVVMGDMEYPKGTGRVTVTNIDFYIQDGKVFFQYTPETAEGCDDFKKALGIN